MLLRRMSAKEARANFSELVGSVYYTKNPVEVERRGKVYAVVVSPEEYERMRQMRDQVWTAVNRVQQANAETSPEDIYQDVTAIVEQVRQNRHERSTKANQGRRRH